uniref:C2 NT-type domain-containing protein n=1 Tax=Rhizophora mucronata TaxID=61149 RepID=A0A2P2IYV9_RHIMU
MAAEYAGRRNSNTQLLEELEALSRSLYQTHTNNPMSSYRRAASLALPRTSLPSVTSADEITTAKAEEKSSTAKHWSRRMSLSPWRSRPKSDHDNADHSKEGPWTAGSYRSPDVENKLDERAASTMSQKKGIWNWKPIRALSHIGMQKLSCLFSVEVVAAQGLPASMNGLRLSVCVRKKEAKEGAVHTMPARVSQGAADFEEVLFVKCHVYCTPGQGRQLKFEARPFWIYLFAVDAQELDFGRSSVDLSLLIQESMEKSLEGTRVRQWDTCFSLSGKAKGGELVLKLGFQIMEDGGIDIYSQAQAQGLKSNKTGAFSPSFGRKQSKISFSVPSPRMSSRAEAWSPSQRKPTADLPDIDDLNLDEPDPVSVPGPSTKKSAEPEPKAEDLDLPDFEVVDKGIEIQDKEEKVKEESDGNSVKSASSEVVKEMVLDQLHLSRLTELASIAQQIKALESMMGAEKIAKIDHGHKTGSQILEAEEETVTKEFLQMLDDEEANTFDFNHHAIPPLQFEGAEDDTETESKLYVSDLGKGLGCVVQTRDGGYLAAMNPIDAVVARKDTPKLAMQLSKPLVLPSQKTISGFELLQRMAAIGLEQLSSQIFSLMPLDELMGKTAEQIAFEGIASAIIHGRSKEGASSSAARTIAAVKVMSSAMNTGRKDRILTGIWNVNENPLTTDEILAFSLQKIEAMAVEALKIQAEMAEEDAPFDVSPLSGNTSSSEKEQNHPLASAIPLEDWIKNQSSANLDDEPGDPVTLTVAVTVQLRDPRRQYETVGGPMIALIHAAPVDVKEDKYDYEKKFKVTSLHVGGLKARPGGKKNAWDSERQGLTSMQWLVAYGLGKRGKKGKHVSVKGQDLLWSISSRIVADMWLKPMRNPDVKFSE